MINKNIPYSEIQLQLLERGSSYLYSTPYPTKPIMFVMKAGVRCVDYKYHLFKLDEKKYGEAMMITRICSLCDYADVEVFPPSRGNHQ